MEDETKKNPAPDNNDNSNKGDSQVNTTTKNAEDPSSGGTGHKKSGEQEEEASAGVVTKSDETNDDKKPSTEAKEGETQVVDGDNGGEAEGKDKVDENVAPAEATEKGEEQEDPKPKGRRGRPPHKESSSTTTGAADDNEKKRSAEEAGGVESPNANASGREKRARKSSNIYVPEDFTKVDHSVTIVPGRGVKLEELAMVKASIEAQCHKHPHVAELAHRIVFGGKGKPPKHSIASNLLAFSGYLPPKPEGMDEKDVEKLDKKLEAKMGERAFKLRVSEIKELCDFFALDRSGMTSKDDLIDCLLDFLSDPSNELVKQGNGSTSTSGKSSPTKGTTATSSSTKKKKKRSSSKGPSKTKKRGKAKKAKDESSEESESESDEEEEEEENDDEEEEVDKDDGIDLQNVKKGEMPNDQALRKWVKCFVQCYDLEKASIKVAMEVAGDKFGVDLSDKKDLVREMLKEAM